MTTYKFDLLDNKYFFVGYEPLIKRFNQLSQDFSTNTPKYPPCNIVKIDENNYVIELAVAGFTKDNIDIESHDNTLTVKGEIDTNKENDSTEFVYRGIANRSFVRNFDLSDTTEVKGAELKDGMLKIFLENIIPDSKKPKKVKINSSSEKNSKEFLKEEGNK
jgi:molecular chaperone IbpA